MRIGAILVGQMFKTMHQMIVIAENGLRGSLSYMMKMGRNSYTVTSYRKDYDSSYRKCFMNLIDMVPRLNINRQEAEDFIIGFTSQKKSKDLARMSIPEELRKLFTPHDLRYVSRFFPVVEIDGNIARLTIPKHINVLITGIYYFWYYINQKYNSAHPDDKLVLEAFVEGTMNVNNEIYDGANDWYACIKRVGTIVSRDTEFKKLDLYLMRDIDADKLILINPVLQKTKYDSDE